MNESDLEKEGKKFNQVALILVGIILIAFATLIVLAWAKAGFTS